MEKERGEFYCYQCPQKEERRNGARRNGKREGRGSKGRGRETEKGGHSEEKEGV